MVFYGYFLYTDVDIDTGLFCDSSGVVEADDNCWQIKYLRLPFFHSRCNLQSILLITANALPQVFLRTSEREQP